MKSTKLISFRKLIIHETNEVSSFQRKVLSPVELPAKKNFWSVSKWQNARSVVLFLFKASLTVSYLTSHPFETLFINGKKLGVYFLSDPKRHSLCPYFSSHISMTPIQKHSLLFIFLRKWNTPLNIWMLSIFNQTKGLTPYPSLTICLLLCLLPWGFLWTPLVNICSVLFCGIFFQ